MLKKVIPLFTFLFMLSASSAFAGWSDIKIVNHDADVSYLIEIYSRKPSEKFKLIGRGTIESAKLYKKHPSGYATILDKNEKYYKKRFRFLVRTQRYVYNACQNILELERIGVRAIVLNSNTTGIPDQRKITPIENQRINFTINNPMAGQDVTHVVITIKNGVPSINIVFI